jgi:hypothetical protein
VVDVIQTTGELARREGSRDLSSWLAEVREVAEIVLLEYRKDERVCFDVA